MVEDMAVVHRLAGELVEVHAHDGLRIGGNVDNIAVVHALEAGCATGEYLHRPDVEVKWMIHCGRVHDGPLFNCAEGNGGVDSVHLERHAIDGELTIEASHAAHSRRHGQLE